MGPWHDCLIDIHLHLDGSLSRANARRLIELGDTEPELSDAELDDLLSVSSDCRDLNEYLGCFVFPLGLMQKRSQITSCVRTLLEELCAKGFIYAEPRFAPQYHLREGLTQREVVEAAIAGLDDGLLPARLILCCMRDDDNLEANLETIELAAEYLGRGVGAIDLAGAEALFPTRDFEVLFDRARELGVPMTIHAGEAAGPQSVREALAFGTRRIGHGIRSAEDPALLEELASAGVVCELCPTSNLHTCVFEEYAEYPLPAFLEAGVAVTINSDNMAVSTTDAGRELDIMAETFSLSDADIERMLLCSAKASFAEAPLKEALKARIRACFGA